MENNNKNSHGNGTWIEYFPLSEMSYKKGETVRVSISEKDGAKSLDIRRFKLIPINGIYDGQKKALANGLTISTDQLDIFMDMMLEGYKAITGKEFSKNE